MQNFLSVLLCLALHDRPRAHGTSERPRVYIYTHINYQFKSNNVQIQQKALYSCRETPVSLPPILSYRKEEQKRRVRGRNNAYYSNQISFQIGNIMLQIEPINKEKLFKTLMFTAIAHVLKVEILSLYLLIDLLIL